MLSVVIFEFAGIVRVGKACLFERAMTDLRLIDIGVELASDQIIERRRASIACHPLVITRRIDDNGCRVVGPSR